MPSGADSAPSMSCRASPPPPPPLPPLGGREQMPLQRHCLAHGGVSNGEADTPVAVNHHVVERVEAAPCGTGRRACAAAASRRGGRSPQPTGGHRGRPRRGRRAGARARCGAPALSTRPAPAHSPGRPRARRGGTPPRRFKASRHQPANRGALPRTWRPTTRCSDAPRGGGADQTQSDRLQKGMVAAALGARNDRGHGDSDKSPTTTPLAPPLPAPSPPRLAHQRCRRGGARLP